MSSRDHSTADFSDLPDGSDFRIHIICSEWNSDITTALLTGAQDILSKANVPSDNMRVVMVPGTFELPVMAKTLLQQKESDAIICLGCVIKGETEHDYFINQSVANALNQLAIVSGKPMVFGVLTVNTLEQAKERAGGKYDNKGSEAALTALRMVHLQKDICKPGKKIGF